MTKKVIYFSLISFLIILPTNFVYALTVVTPVDPYVFLTEIIVFLRNLLMLLAVLFILFGAFLLATAAGDDKKVEKGRRAITFVFVAVVIAALAHGLVLWLQDFIM